MRSTTSRSSRLLLVAVVLLSIDGFSTGVTAQSLFDVIFPCDQPKGCSDPCLPCVAGAGCDTTPTTIRTGLFGWRFCPGCPQLGECWAPPEACCHLTEKPSLVECGSSGCTCCSDGSWVPLESNGSTLSAESVCRGLNLQQGEECQYYACTKDLSPCPDGSSVGRDFTDPGCPFHPCPGD